MRICEPTLKCEPTDLESISSSSEAGFELVELSRGLIDWSDVVSVYSAFLALGFSTVEELATSFDEDLVTVLGAGVTTTSDGGGVALKPNGDNQLVTVIKR